MGGRQALLAERHLDGDVLVQLAKRAPLSDHAVGVLRDDLGRDRATHQVADPADYLAGVPLFLRQERRIGRGAGQNAPGGDLFHLGNAPGVDEQPHAAETTPLPGSIPSLSATATQASDSTRTRSALHPSSPPKASATARTDSPSRS